ncbi:MAG: ABC transporter permease [Dethiobacteria bacterium]
MLWKKMLRDLNDQKGAYLACMVIIVLGLMVFTAFSMMLQNLKLSQQVFYQNQNFADGFAQVEGLPFSEVSKLADLEGIAQIEGRFVTDIRVLFPGREENVYLRLIFVDPEAENRINDMLLLQGRTLQQGKMNIQIDNKFFAANDLNLNDKLEIIAGGRRKELLITGVGTSPEFIYALRTAADIYPTPETFGVAFVPLEMLPTFLPGENTFNDLVFTLNPGADYDDVQRVLKYELEPYGLKSIIARDDQTSHLLLTEEMRGLETMSKVMPVLFLSIAAVILYIVVQRMIEQQRGQIGILKAIGYTNREVILHYLSHTLIIGLAGGLAGTLLGIVLSYPITNLYLLFFNMPILTGKFSTAYYFIFSILLALTFSLSAGYLGCKKVLTLEPAEAMRPPAPPAGKRVWLERIPVLWKMLTVQGMMSVRNIARNKGRSLFIFGGITLCFAISCFSWSMNDLMQKMLFDQYEKVETYDLKITLAAPLTEHRVSRELGAFPGVQHLEAMAEVPVTLQNKWRQKDVQLLGIAENSSLYHILDKNGQEVAPPKDGLLLSERLAMLLHAEPGTMLSVKSLLGDSATREDRDKQLPVVGIIPQYLGLNAYMDLHALQGFLREDGLATSFLLHMDETSVSHLQEEYRQSNFISNMDERRERIRKLDEMMASFGSMIYIYALIGIILGFSIIYISSIITTSERSRELASMMVLGMTPAEVLSVVTFEQWFISALGITAGIPVAKLFMSGISLAMSSDVFTIPPLITTSSYLQAAVVTVVSIWIAQKFAGRKIRRLSLVEVLKSAE